LVASSAIHLRHRRRRRRRILTQHQNRHQNRYHTQHHTHHQSQLRITGLLQRRGQLLSLPRIQRRIQLPCQPLIQLKIPHPCRHQIQHHYQRMAQPRSSLHLIQQGIQTMCHLLVMIDMETKRFGQLQFRRRIQLVFLLPIPLLCPRVSRRKSLRPNQRPIQRLYLRWFQRATRHIHQQTSQHYPLHQFQRRDLPPIRRLCLL